MMAIAILVLTGIPLYHRYHALHIFLRPVLYALRSHDYPAVAERSVSLSWEDGRVAGNSEEDYNRCWLLSPFVTHGGMV